MPETDVKDPEHPIVLNWCRHKSYASASQKQGIIYLFEWENSPFYWGIANRSKFGTRYNVGYRHLIEGCLRNGGKLYIASVPNLPPEVELSHVENFLIVRYGHVMNTRINTNSEPLILSHEGDIPESITSNDGARHEIVQAVIEPVRIELSTIARGKDFAIVLYDTTLDMQSLDGGNSVQLLFVEIMSVLERVNEVHQGNSFPLDNSADPNDDRELGFGTLLCDALGKHRAFAPNASKLVSILCSAGIFDHFEGVGVANNPTRFRLILLPESTVDLVTLIGNIEN